MDVVSDIIGTALPHNCYLHVYVCMYMYICTIKSYSSFPLD